MRYLIPGLVLFTVLMAACHSDEDYIPKPRGYFRVDTPATHSYQVFDQPGYPYSFEYPVYSKISQDSAAFDKNPDNPYWINVEFPELGGVIYLSYKTINSSQSLQKLLEDAHFMSFYHTKKADYQSDYSFRNEYGVQGYLYEWGGDAASKYQFVATDSIKHFIRGALYFNTTPNADSLKPLNDFIRQDIQHMLQSMRWKWSLPEGK